MRKPVWECIQFYKLHFIWKMEQTKRKYVKWTVGEAHNLADCIFILYPGTLMTGKMGSSRRTLYGPIILPAAATKQKKNLLVKIILNKGQ